jgi:hypothetical protein
MKMKNKFSKVAQGIFSGQLFKAFLSRVHSKVFLLIFWIANEMDVYFAVKVNYAKSRGINFLVCNW